MPKTKPSVPFNVRLDSIVYNVLCEYCETHKITKTAVVHKALSKLLRLKVK